MFIGIISARDFPLGRKSLVVPRAARFVAVPLLVFSSGSEAPKSLRTRGCTSARAEYQSNGTLLGDLNASNLMRPYFLSANEWNAHAKVFPVLSQFQNDTVALKTAPPAGTKKRTEDTQK